MNSREYLKSKGIEDGTITLSIDALIIFLDEYNSTPSSPARFVGDEEILDEANSHSVSGIPNNTKLYRDGIIYGMKHYRDLIFSSPPEPIRTKEEIKKTVELVREVMDEYLYISLECGSTVIGGMPKALKSLEFALADQFTGQAAGEREE